MSSFFSQNLSDYYLFNDNRKARLENYWNGSNEIVEASADTSCHQCSTTPSDSLYTFRWMVQSTRHLVKDDVFFTTDSPLSSDITLINQKDPLSDNRSNWVPTPCLSPVTSPSDFLYDREPLFDGIGDFNEHPQTTANPANLLTDTSAALSAAEKLHNNNNCNINKTSYKNKSGFEQDLDWSALSSQFHDSNFYDLPTPAATMSEEDEDDQTVGDTDSEAGLTSPVYSLNVANQAAYTPCGRKRPCSPEPSQDKKRDKKSKIDAEASKDTLFEKLTHSGIDWCRYCGTTEGVNWRPGPWGKRTLCNKHGCDYKGYGLASRLPRLDLSAFAKERLEDRRRPIVQQFCVVCQSPENLNNNRLIPCKGGCSRAYHQYCYSPSASTEEMNDSLWCCNSSCCENGQRNKVYVDLPRKYLPLKNSKKLLFQPIV